MESPTPSGKRHHRRPTIYTSPSKSMMMKGAEHDVNNLQNDNSLHKAVIAADEDDIEEMDPYTPASSPTSRTVPTVQITAPADYFAYKRGTDPTQPVNPIILEQANTSTPPRNVGFGNQKSPTQVPLPPLPQPANLSQKSDIETLNSALSIVRNHLSSLDTGIKRNIAAQGLAQSLKSSLNKSDLPSNTSLVGVSEGGRAPGFKAEDSYASGAVLSTVKACCVLERSLEALIEVLEMAELGEKGEVSWGESTAELERGLIGICMESGVAVKRVMGSAIDGVKSVVGFDGRKGGSG
ncbi:hypothetical protein DL98DRAFT_657270 [Cadophora sp. DSE1049]|nr:hypothetical protein DL98DRAFT_657270 [Cadophora sp. DSE1049]